MIDGFRHKWLQDFFFENKRGKDLPADIEKQLFRRLQMLDDAASESDLRSPPGNHFEQLSGQLSGKFSIRVNLQWRLVFDFDSNAGRATDVYLDPHTYR